MALDIYHRRRNLVCAAFLVAAALPESTPAAPNTSAAVLMYQRVGDERYPTTNVTKAQFEAHLAYLDGNGFQVWPLERLIAQAESGKPFPAKVVALTFDDAYRSTLKNALPQLQARQWPYTLFVWTDAIDGRYGAYMTWDELRTAQSNGATIGNHSANHAHLLARKPQESDAQWNKRVQHNLERAQDRLKSELGTRPALFAYPYGEYDAALATIVSSMGMKGFGEQSGPIGPHADGRALPRFPISQGNTAIEDIALRVHSVEMPVAAANPWSPVHDKNGIPQLEIDLTASLVRPNQLRCFGPANTPLKVTWKDMEKNKFTVAGPATLAADGRTRVNCTAPAGNQTYYWFSRLWVEQPHRLPRAAD